MESPLAGFFVAFCTLSRSFGKGGSERTAAALPALANLLGLKVGFATSERDLLFATLVAEEFPARAGLIDLGCLTIVVVEKNLSMRRR